MKDATSRPLELTAEDAQALVTLLNDLLREASDRALAHGPRQRVGQAELLVPTEPGFDLFRELPAVFTACLTSPGEAPAFRWLRRVRHRGCHAFTWSM